MGKSSYFEVSDTFNASGSYTLREVETYSSSKDLDYQPFWRSGTTNGSSSISSGGELTFTPPLTPNSPQITGTGVTHDGVAINFGFGGLPWPNYIEITPGFRFETYYVNSTTVPMKMATLFSLLAFFNSSNQIAGPALLAQDISVELSGTSEEIVVQYNVYANASFLSPGFLIGSMQYRAPFTSEEFFVNLKTTNGYSYVEVFGLNGTWNYSMAGFMIDFFNVVDGRLISGKYTPQAFGYDPSYKRFAVTDIRGAGIRHPGNIAFDGSDVAKFNSMHLTSWFGRFGNISGGWKLGVI